MAFSVTQYNQHSVIDICKTNHNSMLGSVGLKLWNVAIHCFYRNVKTLEPIKI